MATDPEILPRGQYRNNAVTPVSIGGNSGGDGISNNLWLESDIYSSTPGSATTINIEAKPVGTNFTASAIASSKAIVLKEALLPTQRRGSCLTYDAKNKRFILFGGYNGTTRFNEVWELSADTAYGRWHKLTVAGSPPSAKNIAASTYVRGTTSGSVDKAYMIIWGGATPTNVSEMHSIDLTTPGSESWTTITQTNTPSARSSITHHLVAKPAVSTADLYLFGGNGASRTNDLLRCTFDVNAPTAVTWTTLKSNGAAGNPSVRSGTGMIYDTANDRLIITAGYNGTTYLSDVWQYSISSNTFTQLTVGGTTPGARELHSIGYDPVNQRAILIGGWQGASTNCRNDIVQLSLSSGSETWTILKSNDLNNQNLFAFSNAAAAVDSSRNILVIATMLGYDGTTKYVYAFNMNDTSTNGTIYGLTTVDFFRARDAPAYVFNTARSEFVIINGYSAMDDDGTIARGEHVSEVWAYNQTTNSWRYATKGPFGMPQNEGALAVYDSANDRIIYFGGLTGANQRTNDVWQLKADSHGMYHATRLFPSGTPPSQRWMVAGCYDVTRQRLVLTSGQSASSIFNDTWALSLNLGSEAWTQLSPTGTPPTAAWQSCFAYDAANKRLYMHGGATDASSTTFTSQLLYLDVSTTDCAWVNTNVTGGLAVRGATMAFDAANQRLVVFGGFDGTVVNNTVRYTSTSTFGSWTTQATANTPAARRSAGYMTIGNAFIVTCGRPPTGTWFSDTQELNFTANPASWAWTNKSPTIYQVGAVALSSLINRASYHWQGWGVTGSTTGTAASFGGNPETATDFVAGAAGGKFKIYAGTWTPKPVKYWNGVAWVQKPAKQWNGTAWIQTDY